MEDRYHGGTSHGAKWGCGCGVLIGLIAFAAGEFALFFGDCPPNAACHKGEGLRWLLLLMIAVLIAISTGLGVRRLLNGPKRPHG
jgi:uncharacterized membrane protein